MRRVDREITDRGELLRILAECDVCRIALPDGSFPYIIPLNFGMEEADGGLALYFHGAAEGRKYELIEKAGTASFEVDRGHKLFFDEKKEMCSMAYESVIGRGRISEITDADEKKRALGLILAHYGRGDFPVNEASAAHTRILRLDVIEMTGKRRAAK